MIGNTLETIEEALTNVKSKGISFSAVAVYGRHYGIWDVTPICGSI
jgi:hypothetical protein